MPGSALTRPGCSPSGPPQSQLTGFGSCFDFSRAGPHPPRSVGEAWEVGSVPGLAEGPSSSPVHASSLDVIRGVAGGQLLCPSHGTVFPRHRCGEAGTVGEPASTAWGHRRNQASRPAHHLCPCWNRKPKNSSNAKDQFRAQLRPLCRPHGGGQPFMPKLLAPCTNSDE